MFTLRKQQLVAFCRFEKFYSGRCSCSSPRGLHIGSCISFNWVWYNIPVWFCSISFDMFLWNYIKTLFTWMIRGVSKQSTFLLNNWQSLMMGLKKVISSQGVTVDIVCKPQDALFKFFASVIIEKFCRDGVSRHSYIGYRVHTVQSRLASYGQCKGWKHLEVQRYFVLTLNWGEPPISVFQKKSWEFSPTRGVGGRLLYQLLVKF